MASFTPEQLECIGSLDLLNELWSDEARVEIITLEIGVSRHETLQVNDIVTLVRAFDSLNID
jgi:hypothetical protein